MGSQSVLQDARPFAKRSFNDFRLIPSTCNLQNNSAARIFDAVYMRGFRPIPEWEKVKPFDVIVDQDTGNVTITDQMLAHYYDWRDMGKRFSLSGGGSELHAVGPTLKMIEHVIETYSIKIVADVPCGDVNWQFSSFVVDMLPIYVGLDVARFPIQLNSHRFAHHINKKFMQWDVSSCGLPRLATAGSSLPISFDLIICRDMIQHMPLKLGLRTVQNFAHSGARFLLTTTFDESPGNVDDRKPDAFFENNLAKAPFNFPKPLNCSRSHPARSGQEGDKLCLYNLKDIARVAATYNV